MKKIAIVTRKMITGGVERALIAMLKRFDYSTVEVDLYLEFFGGELFAEIPGEVNCIQLPTVRGMAAFRHPVSAVRKLVAKTKLSRKRYSYLEQCRLYSQMLLPVRKVYDIAISYHAPNTVPVFYVIDSIQAEKKILWLHGDLDTNGGEAELARHYHSQYDRIFAVSQYARNSFLKYHPDREDQTEVFYNYVDAQGIREEAVNGTAYSDGYEGIRILTIARLDAQKGIDLAVDACRELLDRGYSFRWYVCGEGEARKTLEQKISDGRMEDCFILLGNQVNPYPFLKDCDLYVQPSRTEGFCTTTNEAKILGKPVITTAVSGADEQFRHEKTGWIVPIDAQSIANRVAFCLDHPEETEKVRKQMELELTDSDEDIFRIFGFE